MIIQRGTLPYYLCTTLFLSLASGCGMDKANEHLASMDNNTKQLNSNIESYHQDVSQVAHSLENLSQSIQSLQTLAQSMTSSLMGLMRPPGQLPSDPVLDMPSTSPASETESPQSNEEATRYRNEIARLTQQMTVLNETISTLRRQLAPLTTPESGGTNPVPAQHPTPLRSGS